MKERPVLEGDLGDFSLPDVLRLLSFTGKTGRLTLSDGQLTGDIDLVGGRVRHARLGADPLALSRLLVRCGLVDAGTLEEAVARAGPDDRGILPALLTAGRLDDAALAVPLREHVIDVVVALGRWRIGAFRFDATPALDLTDGAPAAGAAVAAPPAVGGFSLPVDVLLAEVDRRLEAHAVLDRAVGAVGDPARRAPQARSGIGDGAVEAGRPSKSRGDDLPSVGHREELARRLFAGTEPDLTAEPPPAAEAPDARPATPDAATPRPAAPDAPAPPPAVLDSGASDTAAPRPAAPRTPAQLAAARQSAPVRRPGGAAATLTAAVPAAAPSKAAARGPAAGRARRLQQDPTIDAELLDRLIAGVRSL